MKSLFKLAAMALLAAGCIYLLRHDNLLADLRAILDSLHPLVAATLLLICFCVGAVMLVPASVFMLASGAYFGLGWGFALSMVGFTGGAVLSFLVSRHLARDLVLHYLPLRIRDQVAALHEHGWKLVALLRLTGLIPSVAINYALGLTPLPLRTFAWATFVFTMPAGLILTYAGMAGDDFVNGGGMKRLLIAVSLMACLSIAGWILRKRFSAA